ncbi:double-strand break repair helicase AddA [Sphingoaurantiacus capsulatus]|uniref:DNA 3'-5' helicase n=1 Tax=Sphingoaurantiacus capsulatus TaxID=1771310 RepID=A0ABV7X8J4_9SPHN
MTAKPLLPLRPEQMRAADPRDNAWVSASAGTGKTQVLTARVLRLLLGGAAPERILCLTFTKAAAAEMQERIFARLTRWVRADDNALDEDLRALGEAPSPERRERARRLFALVVDARGGLRVQTFHSFAQSLLAGFPMEAEVTPGFTVLDDRTGAELRGRVLTDALADDGFAADVAGLAVKLGERQFAAVVGAMLRQREGLRAIGNPIGHRALLRRGLGLPTDGEAGEVLGAALSETHFDHAGLRSFAAACVAWNTKTGLDYADVIAGWLAASPAGRIETFGAVREIFFKKDGDPRSLSPKLAAVADIAARLTDAIAAVAELEAKFAVVEIAAVHLRVGHVLEAGFRLQKARSGLLDFDDMIARVAAMLGQDRMAEWVRFKLDQSIDHILVDEGQDTNAAQWEIARAIADEFFAGVGAREEQRVARTMFAVGDYKQSIFSFQGSDPRVFEEFRRHFATQAADAGAEFHDVPLAESFRSGRAVLDVVDRVIDDLGAEALGLSDEAVPHRVGRAGDPAARVTLWPPEPYSADIDEDSEAEGVEEAAWLPGSVLRLADRIARQVRGWLDDPDMRLANGRRVRPEDILVLVRARGEFVGALVANLHAQRVPVAGVDRLRLTGPIAVQDCLALVRFALQPDDDLTLATLLVSPFIGWTQDELFALAHDRKSMPLWRRLRHRAESDAHAAVAKAWLDEVLGLADLKPPHEFFETILSGPLNGRAGLLARLGEEARDQIEALLAQALAFEGAHSPSLQGFLAWIETDDIELKRDPDAPADAVRIMTVHGAKGLQAPVVILADAARAPNERASDHVLLTLDNIPDVPIFYGGKEGRVGTIATQIDDNLRRAGEEHWRLLYVALTRAEDMLFVGGALGAREEVPHPNSWHAKVKAALEGLGAQAIEDALWGEVLVHAVGTQAPPAEASAKELAPLAEVPGWAREKPAPEPAPPRPLSPSQLAADDVASPPPSKVMIDAARRGSLLHKLFERLPDVAPDKREPAALAWLAKQARDLDDPTRAALARQALGVIEAPAFAELFGPDALAEAPVAAVVGTAVIAGKVDRLLIQPDRVQVIDFKTGLKVPADAGEVSGYHLKQMAAYVAALKRIFPGRRVEAALLYTEVAKLIELPAELLTANEPAVALL